MLPSRHDGSKTMDDSIDPTLLENWEAQYGFFPDPYAE